MKIHYAWGAKGPGFKSRRPDHFSDEPIRVNMKKAMALLIVVVVLGGLAYGAASRHFVKTDKGAIVLVKRFLTVADTFVDVRAWSSDDFDAHPELKRALVEQGYADLLAQLKAREREAALGDIKDRAAALAGAVAAKVSETAADVAATVSETAEDVATEVSEKAGAVAAKVSEAVAPEK